MIRRKRASAIREGRAVSPVVATLILILVAVAAAAALYLWLVAWQGGVTGSIGSPTAQYTITIGGSTSVYPFDQLAVAQFQQNNSNIVVSDNQGGSGAGMIAVCGANVDIGATSSLQTPANLEANYGCPQGGLNQPVVTTVAYDGVDLITSFANAHGLISMSADTLLTVYIQASSTPFLGTYVHLVNGAAPVSATALTWNQIPACVAQSTGTGCAGGTETATTTGATVTPCAPPFANDICAATTTPCGWTVCAGGANNAISTVTRSDPGGTVQSFTARLLGISGTSPVSSLSSLLGNWGGCGSDGQLGSCGITADVAELGNPGVISYVAGHPDAFGFASDGLARVASSGVSCEGVATAVCGIAFQGIGQTSAIQPSLGSSGTIASSIKTGMTATTGYAGWRPFQWVTLGNPTGETLRLLQFVQDPSNNQAFATEANEISIYQV
ncbi:MAG: substrate-binding domain-containing protein [Thermoplasmata archaeon]|nr:substrate-binding domain-containing protein [Thermoplasmata archaeon]